MPEVEYLVCVTSDVSPTVYHTRAHVHMCNHATDYALRTS